MSESPTAPLLSASFNPRVRNYWLMSGTWVLLITVAGIPLLLPWWILGMWITQRYLDRMECTLTKRSLIVRKGIMVRVEKTIPLDKITDLGMIQGPLMRVFGVHALSIETAGSTSQGALVKLYGIDDVESFRDRVLSQRDQLLEQGSGNRASLPAPATAAVSGTESGDAVALLREIRDLLKDRS